MSHHLTRKVYDYAPNGQSVDLAQGNRFFAVLCLAFNFTKGLAMDHALSKYMLKSVPRYTSYPTIPHFGEVEQESYVGWLGGLDQQEPISLYIHIPFCKQLCWYCACNMKLANRYEPITKYVEMLIQEITLVAGKIPAKMKVSHLHWGGGTPTALRSDDLKRIMDHVRNLFEILPTSELAIEIDPRTLEDEMVDMLGEIGFNRASFGVQEFDPTVQNAINRIQPPEMVAECVAKLKASGIEHINFDLIYGLPMQTEAMIEKTISLCSQIRPSRLALFGYAHVPWMAKKQRLIDSDSLPGLQERYRLATLSGELLEQHGYQAIGFDHYALPDDALAIAANTGNLRRNFQGFTDDTASTLIGFGSTSIGKTPDGYVQNISETNAWSRAVEHGLLPIARGKAFTAEDRMRAEIIDALMCIGEVDLGPVMEKHASGTNWRTLFDLTAYVKDGMVTISDNRVSLTDSGKEVVRVVCTAFDEYYIEQPEKHSLAV